MSLIANLQNRARRVSFDRGYLQADAARWARGFLPLLREIADPRGRCNRKAFLHVALAFLALQLGVAAGLWLAGVEMGQTGTLVLNAPILWIGSTICVKRLHDVGRRGWWILGAFAVWFLAAMIVATIVSMVVGADAVEPGELAFYGIFAAMTLPVFGALIWLHTAPSATTANRFGPVPTGRGLSMPARTAKTAKTTKAPRATWTTSVLA